MEHHTVHKYLNYRGHVAPGPDCSLVFYVHARPAARLAVKPSLGLADAMPMSAFSNDAADAVLLLPIIFLPPPARCILLYLSGSSHEQLVFKLLLVRELKN